MVRYDSFTRSSLEKGFIDLEIAGNCQSRSFCEIAPNAVLWSFFLAGQYYRIGPGTESEAARDCPMNRSLNLFAKSRTPFLRTFTDLNVPTPQIQKTALNEVHKQMGGKMVEFCGWELPVQYEAGVLREHIACRTQAALFDVSHMGQLRYVPT